MPSTNRFPARIPRVYRKKCRWEMAKLSFSTPEARLGFYVALFIRSSGVTRIAPPHTSGLHLHREFAELYAAIPRGANGLASTQSGGPKAPAFDSASPPLTPHRMLPPPSRDTGSPVPLDGTRRRRFTLVDIIFFPSLIDASDECPPSGLCPTRVT